MNIPRRELELLGLNAIAFGTTIAFGSQPSGMIAAALFNFGLRCFTHQLVKRKKISPAYKSFIDRFGDAGVTSAAITYLYGGTATFLVDYGLNKRVASVFAKGFTYGFVGGVYKRDASYFLDVMYPSEHKREDSDTFFALKYFAMQLAKYSFLPDGMRTLNDLLWQFVGGCARNFTMVAVGFHQKVESLSVPTFFSKEGALKTIYHTGMGGMSMSIYTVAVMMHEVNPLKKYLGNAATFAPWVGIIDNVMTHAMTYFSANDFAKLFVSAEKEDKKSR